MSLELARQRIVCDNSECAEVTPLPISLPGRSTDARLLQRAESSAAGWVFVAGADEVRHYCPHCGRKMFPGRAT